MLRVQIASLRSWKSFSCNEHAQAEKIQGRRLQLRPRGRTRKAADGLVQQEQAGRGGQVKIRVRH